MKLRDIDSNITDTESKITYHLNTIRKLKAKLRGLIRLKANDCKITMSDHAALIYISTLTAQQIEVMNNSNKIAIFVDKIKEDVITINKDKIMHNYGKCIITYENIKFSVKDYIIVTIKT